MISTFPLKSLKILKHPYESEELKKTIPEGHIIDFQNNPSNIYVVVGANGSGKTTLLKIIQESTNHLQKYQEDFIKPDLSNIGNRYGEKFIQPMFNEYKSYISRSGEKRDFPHLNYLVSNYFNLPLFNLSEFNALFKNISEEKLEQRISRNINGKKKDVINITKRFSEKYNISFEETLSRITFIVESGLTLIQAPIPENKFRYGSLSFYDKKVPNSLEIKTLVPIISPDKKSSGEGTMDELRKLSDYVPKKNCLIMMDEVTQFLDMKNKEEAYSLIKNFNKPLLIATNDFGLVQKMNGGAKIINLYENPCKITDKFLHYLFFLK